MRRIAWTPFDTAIAIIVIVVAVVIAIVLSSHKRGIPAKDQHSLDSLTITKPIYDSTQHALAKTETLYVARVNTIVRQDTALQREASMLHRQADSLAAQARLSGDTTTKLWTAFVARTKEAALEHLRADSLSSALTTERQATLIADQRASNAEHRLTAAEELNTRLAFDAKRASECRVLFWPCPSRKEVAIGTAVATVLVVKYGAQIEHSAKSVIPILP